MNHASADPRYNTTNELAKERNRAAAERTLTAWIANCLTLIGFGVAFDQIFGAVHYTFPNLNSTLSQEFATFVGLGAIILGLFLLLLSSIEYPLKLKAIERENYLYSPTYLSITIMVSSVVLFGGIALVAVLLSIANV